MPVDEQGTNVTVGTVTKVNPSMNRPFVVGGDICEADDGKLATARSSRTPQFPPRFSEASHAAKTLSFFSASLLMVKTFSRDAVS